VKREKFNLLCVIMHICEVTAEQLFVFFVCNVILKYNRSSRGISATAELLGIAVAIIL